MAHAKNDKDEELQFISKEVKFSKLQHLSGLHGGMEFGKAEHTFGKQRAAT